MEVEHARTDAVVRFELLGRAQRSWTVTPRPASVTSSPPRTTTRCADRELLVGAIQRRARASARAQVTDPGTIGHGRDQTRRLIRVGRPQHDGAVHGAPRGEVLEAHLRRPVLAARHAGVRATAARVYATEGRDVSGPTDAITRSDGDARP